MLEAELDARELRAKTWTKRGPDGIFLPVDPFTIAMDLGIQVFSGRDMASEISGALTKWTEYADLEILLNGADSRGRKRFTCAHELGHYALRMKTGMVGAWQYVDGRDLLSPPESDPEEVYASHFAAELVMPRELVLDRARVSSAALLAVDFGVSGDAMRFRLDSLEVG